MTSDHIPIKIKILNPSQEPSRSTKAPYQDLKEMDALCIFRTKIKESKFRSWVYQSPVPITKSRSRRQTQIRNLQCPPNPIQDLKDMDALWTFKINKESQNLELHISNTIDHIQKLQDKNPSKVFHGWKKWKNLKKSGHFYLKDKKKFNQEKFRTLSSWKQLRCKKSGHFLVCINKM